MRIPTAKTKKNQSPTPEKMIPLFSVQPFGDAKMTGTPTTKPNETATKANRVNWKISVIEELKKMQMFEFK